MFVTKDGLIAAGEMNLRLLALCSIEGVNWNVIAREALRSGGLARLLVGEVAETSRDGETTRRRLTAQLATLGERIERVRELVGLAEEKAQARLVTPRPLSRVRPSPSRGREMREPRLSF